MKFPSLHSVVAGARRTFLRFPLAIVLAIAATVFCIRQVYLPYEEGPGWYWLKNAIAAAYLGMMLSIALTVLAERRAFGRGLVWGLQGAVAVLTVGYYFLLPDHFTAQALIRFSLYALGLHWLIACIAFIGRRQNNGFWVYNKKLFLRILTSVLYTVVLYLGLILALLAIEKLFGVNVNGHIYESIWCVLAGVFNTWFFLAGVPSEYENPEVIADYPKGLKIFTQFVLMPLLTVYLLILYSYLFRILFTAVWPYGWVSYLVLGFSVAGILAILLVWPLREEENNKWISGYSRFFYFALFPLIVMLFIAIFKRVMAYGITELRYLVLLLAVWLLFVAVYFLVSKRKDIQLIPLSLCVTAFLVSFGGWGIFSVSLASQQRRLKTVLVRNQLFAGGKVTGATRFVPLKDRKEISDITQYIVGVHGYRVLQPWFPQNLDSLMAKGAEPELRYASYSSNSQSRVLLRAMKVEYADRWGGLDEANDGSPFYFQSKGNYDEVVSVKGYDYLIWELWIGSSDTGVTQKRLGEYPLRIQLDTMSRLKLYPDADSTLVIDLRPMISQGTPGGTIEIPADSMTLSKENSQWSCRLVIEQCNGMEKGDKKWITHLSAKLLMKKK